LVTVSRSFMNVANSVLWRMAIILKDDKVNWFVFSVLFVFWYHSPNLLDTPRIMKATYEISDFRHKYMRTVLLWVFTQRIVVIPYIRFGTTYPPHLQGSRIKEASSLNLLRLKMGPINRPEKLIRNYHCIPRRVQFSSSSNVA
jgi:hypothetical protein